MDMKERMKQAKEDIKKLGIINIEASGDLTPAYVCDAVDAVKEINLNFKELAEESKRLQSNPLK